MAKLVRYVALLSEYNLLDYSFNPGAVSLNGSDVVQQDGGGLYLLNNPLSPLFSGMGDHFNYGSASNATNATNVTNPGTQINNSDISNNNNTSPHIYLNTQAVGGASRGHEDGQMPRASSGDAAGKPHTPPFALAPADANPAPVTHIPGTVLRITEDTPAKSIHGISVSDADANSEITVHLSVAHGTLGVSTTLSSRLTDAGISGLTNAGIQGQGTNTLILTGTATAINATLTTLTYTVTPDYNGSDTLTVSSSVGNTPAEGSSGTMAIDVAAVNDAPTLAGIPAGTQSIITNQAAALADFRVDGADAANPPLNPSLLTLFVTLTPTGGSIGGFTDGSVDGLLTHLEGNTVHLTGTAALINAALAAATFTASGAGAASMAVSVSNVALGDSTSAASGTYNFMAYAAPTLNLPNGRNSFVNASHNTLDVEVAFANLLAGDTVQLKLGTENLGSVHTITQSEAQANKLSLTVNKPDLGADGSKTLTALITQGNISQAALTSAVNLTLDTAAPTLAITSSATSVKAGETATITFTFSEEPTDFDSSVIVVTGGTLGALSGTGTTRTATFTPTPDTDSTTASISVEGGENSYTDAAGNFGNAGSTPTLTVDTKAPTLVITSSVSAVKAGETATITFTFSETPTDFDSSDITVTGGTLGTLSGNGATRTATFTPTANTDSTTASITVAANGYTDAVGNSGGAGTTPMLTVDTTAPTLVITSSVSAVKAGETATITFTFSEAPTDFDSSDIVVTGGTLGTLSGSGTTRTATFTPTANTDSTTASITVAANGYTDAAGNSGGAGTTPMFTVDTTAPTLAITSSVSAVKVGETATITFTFSEAPTGFDSSDITVTGGTLGTLSGSGTTRTATFTPTTNTDSTTASITVAANGYTDAAGNSGGAGSTPTLTVDTRAPTLVITSSATAVKAGETATITFTFSETPTDFDSSDIVVTGGTLGTLTGNGTTRTATFTPTANTDSTTASITVAANGYTDAAGNNGGAGTAPMLTVDTTAPTLVITSSVSAVKAGETATITFTFSEAPTGFDSSDIVVTGGTLGTLSGSGTTRTATFTPTANIDSTAASITVAANGYTDAAGNSGGAGTTPMLTVDTTAPTLAITSSVSAVKAGETATITFTFSETPTDFDSSDIVVTGGTLGTLSGNGTTRTATFTPTANTDSTTASITVAANGYTDAAGNNGGAGSTPMLTVDTTAPTLAITSSATAVKAGETATITFTFSETPTGFDNSDIVVTGGTLGTLTGNGTTRTATFTPTPGIDSTTASITVAANGYTDAAGNSGGAGTTPMLTVDTTAPTLAITSSVSAVKVGETATITFTFSEAPTDFDSSDITVTGGTLGTLSGSGTTRTATFTPTANTDSTTASITVAANSYTDAAGNSGGAGTTPMLTVDTTAPTLVITSSATAVKAGETATITFTFSEAPTDFDSSDIVVTGGTLGTLSGNGTTRTATFTPTANTDSTTASITVAANGYTDAAGNSGGAGTTPMLTVDTTAPTLVITSSVSAVKVGETATITFTFSEAPTGFDSSDIVTTGGTLGTLSGTGTTRTATFTPTANIDSTAASITVAANGYTDAAGNSGGAGTTPTLTVDTTAPTLVITSSATAVKAGETATITFTFSETPTGFDSSDIVVTGGTLGTLSGTGTTRTATFTPTTNTDSTTASITVAANGYTDAAGNSGGAGTTPMLTVDTTAPTLAITSSVSAVKVGETATITFTFSEAPTDFDSSDITVTGGTLGTLSGSGTTRTATFTPTPGIDSTTASITVAANGYTDAAGNSGGAGTTPMLTVDTKAPTLTITSDKSALKKGETATITFTFSEDPGSSFIASDITLPSGGQISGLTTTGTTRTATFTPTDDVNAGSASISVASGTFTDAAGNDGTGASASSINFDTGAPAAPTLATGAGVSNGATAAEATASTGVVTVHAESGSRVLVTFTDSDSPAHSVVKTATGTGSAQAVTLASTDLGTGAASLLDGTITVSATATDAAGNTSTAGTGTFTLDTVAPTLTTITSDKSALKKGETATITFTFSEDPGSSFIASDITLPSGGQISGLTTTGTTRTATFTPTDDVNAGSASISVASGTFTDAAGNDGTGASASSINFDTGAPAAPTLATGAGVSNGATAAEATASTGVVTVHAESGSRVLVTFTDSDSPAHSVVKTATGTGSAQAVTLASTDLGTGAASLLDGTITVSATATDAAGNTSTAGTGTFTLDTVAPTLTTITSDKSALKKGETATITFTFSEDPGSSFIASDITLPSGGQISGLTTTGTTRTATFTPTDDVNAGSASISVASGTFTDAAGNDGTGASASSINFDTGAPAAPTLATGAGVSGGATAAEATASTGVVTVHAESGSRVLVTFTDNAATPHSVVKTATGTGSAQAVTLASTDLGTGAASLLDGTITVSAVATDAAGNTSTAGTGTFTLDTVAPTLTTITSDRTALKKGETATITFTFSEDPGNSFIASDITTLAGNGTLGTLSGSGTTRTATFTPTDGVNAGSASISVADGTFTDAAGNPGTGASASTISFDTMAPAAPTLATGAGVSNGATAAEATATTGVVTVHAESGSRVLVTFTDSDSPAHSVVKTATGTGAAQGVTLDSADLGTGAAKLLDGTITVSATATDVAGNTSTAGTGTFTLDTVAPTLTTISSDKSALKKGETATITFTFSEDPGSSFIASDITLPSGGQISGLTTTGTTRTATFTPSDDVNAGSASISVANGTFTDAAGNDGTGASALSISFDTKIPTLTSASLQDTTALTLTFDSALDSGAFTGITTTDLNSLFSFKTSGSSGGTYTTVSNAFTAITVSGSTVTLTLGNTAYTTGQFAKISYTDTDTASDQTTRVVQDVAGNDLASFTDTAVITSPVILGFAVSDTVSSNGMALGKGGEAVSVVVTFSESVTLTASSTYTVHVQIGSNASDGFDATFAPTSATAASSYTFQGTLPSTPGLSTSDLQITLLTVPDGASIINAAAQALTETTYMLHSSGYTVDTAAPLAPSVGLAVDSGSSSTDGISNNANVNVTLAEAGGTWQFSTNGGSTWTTGSGSSFMLTADQTYAAGSIKVRQTDAAGNVGAIGGITTALTLDTAAPSAPTSVSLAADTGSSSTDGITKNAQVNVTLAEAGGTWQFSTDSGSTWTTGSGSSFMLATDQTYAAGSIQVRQTDAAGNVGASAGITTALTLDTAAPLAPSVALDVDTGSSSTDGITSNRNVNVTLAEAGGTWQFSTDSGGTWTTGNGSSFMLAANQTYAANAIQVRQTDAAGNVGAMRGNATAVTVDTTVPTFSSLTAAPDFAENTATAVAVYTAMASDTGTVTGTVTYSLKAGTGDAALFNININSGVVTFKASPNYEAGKHSYGFSVIATDAAGNTNEQTVTANLTDVNEAPKVKATAPESVIFFIGSSTDSLNLDEVFTDEDAGDTLTYSLSSGTLPSGLTLASGVISGTPAAGATGGSVTLTASDGHSHMVSTTLRIDVSTRPRVSSISVSDSGSGAMGETGKSGDTVMLDVTLSETVTFTGTPSSTNLVPGFSAGAGGAALTGISFVNHTTVDGKTVLHFTGTLPGGNAGSVVLTSLMISGGLVLTGSVSNQTMLASQTGLGLSDSYALDNSPPAAPTSVALAADTGSSSTDGITKNAQVNVTLAEAGGTWQFSIDGGGTWSTGNGAFFMLTADQTYAANAIQVRQTDAAGNVGASAGITTALTLDTTAPSLSDAPTLALMHGNAAASANLVAGDTIVLTIPLGEAATRLAGLPGAASTNGTVITLGGSAKAGAIWSTSGSNLLLTYTVVPGDSGAISVDATALKTALGNSITDTAGNLATLGGGVWGSNSFTAPATPALTVSAPSLPTVSSFAVSDLVTANGANLGKGGELVQVEVTFSDTVTLTANKTYTVHVKVGTGSEGFDAVLDTTASGLNPATHYTFSGNLPSTAGLSTSALQLTLLTVPSGASILNTSAQALTETTYTLRSNAYTVDTSPPTLAISSSVSAVKAGQTATITFAFSEDPGSSFDSSDIVATGGTISGLSTTGSVRTATFTPTANTDSTAASITVAANGYTDAAGNSGGAGTTPTLTVDTKAPTLTITSDRTALKKGETASITFTFSEDPGSSFNWDGSMGDVTVTGGTLGSLGSSGAVRTATFTPTDGTNAGSASISVANGMFNDAAGNNGTGGSAPAIGFDTLAPLAPGFSPNANATVRIASVTASGEFSDYAGSQISIGRNSDGSYSVYNGVTVAESTGLYPGGDHISFEELEALIGPAANPATFNIHRTRLQSLAIPGKTYVVDVTAESGSSVLITLTDSASPTTHSFIKTVIGTGSALAVTLDSADVTGAAVLQDGTITISAVATDAAGNASSAGTGSFRLDTTDPTVTSIAFAGKSEAVYAVLNAGDTLDVAVTFSEDVTITGSPRVALTIGSSTGYATFDDSIAGTTDRKKFFRYTVAAGDADANGVSIAANALGLNIGADLATIKDAAGNVTKLGHALVADNPSYRIDTSSSWTPTFTLGAGVSGGATAAEATAATGVVSLVAKNDSTVVVSFTGANGTVVAKTLHGERSISDVLANSPYDVGVGQVNFMVRNFNGSYQIERRNRDTGAVESFSETLDFETFLGQMLNIYGANEEPIRVAVRSLASNGAVVLTADDVVALGQGTVTVSATATDAAGHVSTAGTSSFTLDTTAPTFANPTVTATAIAENGAAGAVIHTAQATDAGGGYSLKANTGDVAAFTINNSTGAVTLKASPDFETKASYSFTVIATDAAGNTAEQTVSLSITDVAETVTLTSSLVGNSDKALDVTSDLVFGVGVGSTGFTGTLAGVAGMSIRITDNGHLGTPAADTGYAGEDETHTFTIPVLIGGALNPLITISGSGASTKITISPDAHFDFDLSANYTIDIPAGAFVSGSTSSAAMTVSFNTVTPGTVAVPTLVKPGVVTGTFTGSQAYRMDSSGALVESNKWVNMDGLGDSAEEAEVSLDLADGNFTVVMRDSLDEATDIDSGTIGIAPTTDLAVLLKNFGTADRIYVDDQFHDGTMLNEPTQLGESGSGTAAAPLKIALVPPAASTTDPYISIAFTSTITAPLVVPIDPTVAMWNSVLFTTDTSNPYNSLIISG